ncbi:hypothetical protein DAPPUDRAFT_314205 [Daphnia pulex]|uniref:Uncharacterized protein n=1 Tax=Daphnia pulex TaxID=6669 RepID=E9G4Y5_DAPPU|nr:hypothetical protein DAPPUDRAFT_314205 [Daphnia pulex]|eukprot:EFX85478.1 hypothetical protein DAPPUDRAFT_314205 [Daphnia pulex]
MASSNTQNCAESEDNSKDDQLSSIKKQKVDHDLFKQTEIPCLEEKEERCSGTRSVYFSCFNPVWPILACGLSGGTILIIQGEKKTDLVATWENKRWFNINATSATTDLGWNMDGTLLLTTFLDGKLVLWNKDTENLMEVNDTSGEQVWAIIWNPFLPYMFATRNNKTVLVWDDAKDQPRLLEKKFALHTSTIRDFVWISVDQFVSCSDDGLILLCHIEKDYSLKSFSHEEAILTLSWNNISNLLGCLSRDGTLKVLSMKKNEPEFVSKNERMKRPTCIAWYPTHSSQITESNSTLIACGMENGSVVFWDIRGKGDPVRYLLEQTNSIWDVSFSPDGMFLTSIDLQGELVIWSTETWEIIFKSKLSFRASKGILLWGGDGHKLAIANSSEQIHILEAVEARETH